MNEKALITDHGHGRRVLLPEVYNVPEVDRTATWNPIHHKEIDIGLRDAMDLYDYEIKDAQYSLSHNGMRMFGVYILTNGDDGDKSFSLGFRNAMDKSMSIGICAGTYVFVCTNLAFSGSFLEFRKHTARLDVAEIRQISERAVEQIGRELGSFFDWHEKLKEYAIRRSDAEALTFRAIEKNVLPAGRFGKFHDIFFNHNGDGDYGEDLYGFHGALTELRRDNSLIGSGMWNKELNKLMDSAVIDIKNYGEIMN